MATFHHLGGLHLHGIAQGAHALGVDRCGHGGEQGCIGNAALTGGQHGEAHDAGVWTVDAHVGHEGAGAHGVEAVALGAASGADAFQRRLGTLAQASIALVGGRHGRHGGRVAGVEHQALDLDVARELIEIGAGGIGQHAGLGRVVDALAQQQLAVGHHLQQLDGGVRLQHLGELRVQRRQQRELLLVDGFEVQRLDDLGRGRAASCRSRCGPQLRSAGSPGCAARPCGV